MEILRPTAGSHIWSCRRRLRSLQTQRYLTQLLTGVKDKTWELLSFLVLSPLQRTHAAALALTRQVGEEIDPFADWEPEETKTPATSNWRRKDSNRKRSSPASRKQSELSTVTSTPRLATEEDEDSEPWVRELVLSLVNSLHTDKREFVTVIDKKKKREIGKKREVQSKRYTGRGRRTDPKPRQPPSPPLLRPVEVVSPVNSTLWLHSDLVDFQTAVGEALEQSSIVRLLLTEKIQRLAHCHFPGAKAEIYGSFATQLALPTSDFDLVILYKKIQSREAAQQGVRTLASTLVNQTFTRDLNLLDSATVPLVRFNVDCGFFEGCGDLKVDISFDRKRAGWTHSGLLSAQYVRELIAIRPGLRSLVLALKRLLTLHGLNCAYTGGLSSYALFIWTAAYIGEAPCADFGKMLIGFLGFYGREFDPRAIGVSLNAR